MKIIGKYHLNRNWREKRNLKKKKNIISNARMGTEQATKTGFFPRQGLDLDVVIAEFQQEPLHPKPETAILVYLFSHAMGDSESPRPHETPLSIDSLDEGLTEYGDALNEMESIQWIERSGKVLELTPSGSGIAQRLYHQVDGI